MNCPNCGNELKEGFLYCENCGQDIHIVPDFEPEVEFSLEQTLSGIVEEIRHEEQDTDKDAASKKEKKRRPFRVLTAVGIMLGVFLILGVTAGLLLSRYNSLDFQMKKAVQAAEDAAYDKAIRHYMRAIELDTQNIELQFALAEVYFLKNNKIEYEYLLREIVKNPRATTEQLERAYGKLIAIYKAREDYQTINDLLLGSGNDSIISTYQSYIAMEPEFSIQEGYYTSVQPLKITAFGEGKIFYTLDGSTPNENSSQYTAPLILDEGDYVISAYFVNDNGITSECVTKEYHIEIDQIPAPDVSAVSGDYFFPMMIEILGDTNNVFYTMDGTNPTYSSSIYQGPIPMPLGKSVFKFARIEEGVTGDVAERTYELVLNTDYTPEDAVEIVTEYAVASGKIYDKSGVFDDTEARYAYEYQYVRNINRVDDFYVVSEIFKDTAGILTKTGNDFAVNAYTGRLFKLQRDTNNQLALVETEEPKE